MIDIKQNLDLRVVKTHKNIQDTFIRLLQQQNFESITIKHILDEALINRSTFYKHYQDKYDLVDTMVEELLERFENDIEARFALNSDGLSIKLKYFYESLFQKRDKILVLLDIRTTKHHLSEDIRKILIAKYLMYMIKSSDQESDIEMSYQSELYASIVITSIKWLLELGEKEGIEVIVERSLNKMTKTIADLFGTKIR